MADMGAVRYAGKSTPTIAQLVDRARTLLEELDGELP